MTNQRHCLSGIYMKGDPLQDRNLFAGGIMKWNISQCDISFEVECIIDQTRICVLLVQDLHNTICAANDTLKLCGKVS